MTSMEMYAAQVILLLVAAGLSVTTWLRVPIGLVAAAAVLVVEMDPLRAAAAAALGVTAGRWLLASEARANVQRGRPGTEGQYGSVVSGWLAGHPAYQLLTFILGAVPLTPGPTLWKIIGSVGAPRAWVAAGTALGQTALIWITTNIWLYVAGELSATDAAGARALAAIGIVVAFLSIVRSIDWQHLRAEGRLRIHPERARDHRTDRFVRTLVEHEGGRKSTDPTPPEVIDIDEADVRELDPAQDPRDGTDSASDGDADDRHQS